MKPILAAIAVAILSACGSGDPPPDSPTQRPAFEQPQGVTDDPQASVATALAAPAPAEVPVLSSVPAATTEDGPPRAVGSGSARLAVEPGLNLPMPSVLRNTVAAGLTAPTDLAFSSDGVLFYCERLQGLFVQRPGQPAVAVFTPKELVTQGSVGMLSVAADPQFSRNRYVFVLLKAIVDGVDASRVVRLTLDETLGKVAERRDILVSDSRPPADSVARGATQVGGVLRFGPEGFLYVGLGDIHMATAPQSPAQLAGKVLRIDREGKAVPSNRAPAGYDGRIYAYGMREPVALAFHASTETLLVGQRQGPRPDDLNWTLPGTNAGWDPRCAVASSGYCEPAIVPVVPSGSPRGWQSARPGEGLTAIERLRTPNWGEWRNAFIVGFDKAQRLDLIKFDSKGRVVKAIPVLRNMGVGFKAIAQGPDGLYVMTSGKAGGEEIWRLSAY